MTLLLKFPTNFSEILELFLIQTFLSFFCLINGVTRMKIFCKTKHLSTLAEELWRTPLSQDFLLKVSQYGPGFYDIDQNFMNFLSF